MIGLPRAAYWSIFLVALAMQLLEVSITRVFSFVLWSHLAFLAVSVALFGISASGVYLYVRSDAFPSERVFASQSKACRLMALSILATTLLTSYLPLDPMRSSGELWLLAAVYLIASIPFFFAGLAISLVLTHRSEHVNRLYAFDLVGAGAGCLIVIKVLDYMGAPNALLLAATCAAAAAALLSTIQAPSSESTGSELPSRSSLFGPTLLAWGGAIIAFAGLFGRPVIESFGREVYERSPHVHSFDYFLPMIRSVLAPRLHGLALVGVAIAVAALSYRQARRRDARPASRESHLAVATLVVCVGVFLAGLVFGAADIAFAKGKLQIPDFSAWNSFSRIAVHGPPSEPGPYDPNEYIHWGISEVFSGDAPSQMGLDIDAAAGTPITAFDGDVSSLELSTHDITTLGHRAISPGAKALVIGAGGGRDVLSALAFGVEHVTAVEINPIILEDVMLDRYLEFSGGLFKRDDVTPVVSEGRAYVRSSTERYDLIQLSMVDSWAATAAGVFSFTENNLYTVEAFRDYLEHLTPDGVLVISRWYLHPPRETLRVASIARRALEELGASEPGRHFFAGLRSREAEGRGSVATVVIGRQPLRDEAVARMQEAMDRLKFDPLYAPSGEGRPPFVAIIDGDSPMEYANTYAFDVRPVTDDRPFFFQRSWPRQLFLGGLGRSVDHSGSAMDAGALVASRLFWIALALVALLIALPLIWFRGRELGKEGSDGLWSALAYFSCLGAGFIIVEIILIQRFVLYLGNPTHALAVVLFVVLSCSGAGSALARAIPDDRLWPRLALVCLGVAALGTAHALFAEGAFHATIHLPIASKVAISVAMLAPLAVLMGMPMPTGIRILDRCGFHTLVPWCWAVNGATSVLGSIAALLGAMVYGFTVMMLVGVSIYLVAIPVVGRLHRRL